MINEYTCSACGKESIKEVLNDDEVVKRFVESALDTIAQSTAELSICSYCVMARLSLTFFQMNRVAFGEQYLCALEMWIDEARKQARG